MEFYDCAFQLRNPQAKPFILQGKLGVNTKCRFKSDRSSSTDCPESEETLWCQPYYSPLRQPVTGAGLI